MTQLEQDIHQWANQKLGDRNLPSRLRKLGEEMGELAEAIALQGPTEHIVAEAADCVIVLTDLCALLGVSLSDAVRHKFDIVRAR